MRVEISRPSSPTRPHEARPAPRWSRGLAVVASLLRQIEQWLGRSISWQLVAGALLVLQAVLVLTHEPWLDEYQALQIALQSPDLAALFENLRYEGHPPLWYLLLRGAALILPPAWVLPLVALPIAVGIQCILLLRTPFSRLERLLIAGSFFILFDFTTLSRSLALGVLLLLIAYAWRERRLAWIAIALLPLVDFLFGVLAVLLIVLQWRDGRLWKPGLAAFALCGLASAWTVRPAPDMIPAFWLNGIILDGLVTMSRIGALLLPLHTSAGMLVWNYPPPLEIALPGGVTFLAMGYLLLRRDRLSAALFLGFMAFCLIFSVAVYPLAIRHLSLGALLLILLVWHQRERGAAASPIFLAWLAGAAICGLMTAAINLAMPFDTANQAARYIAAHHLEKRHWVSFPDSRAQGVSALLGIEFERLERGCTQSFIRWNFRSRIKRLHHLEEELGRVAARQGSFYWLTDARMPLHKVRRPSDYKLLTHIDAGYDGQDYYLYQVRPDLPERGDPAPQCAPRRVPLRLQAGAA